MKRVLIVEDDSDIANLLILHLKDQFEEVVWKADGQLGQDAALNEPFDLMILDVMLPKVQGIDICRLVRSNNISTPIIMLTAKSDEIDKVLGLELGADDYVTKPFSIRELLARIKAIFRMRDMLQQSLSQSSSKDILDFGDLVINIPTRKVSLKGKKLELAPKEYELLLLMAANPGKSYSRAQLLDLIWGYDFAGYEHTVNSHINRLRNKIEENTNEPKYILTTWAVGYRFNEDSI